MVTVSQIEPTPSPSSASPMLDIVSRERQKSLMLRAWILIGLFFMALPGTLLGFSNLIAISTSHGASPLPAAWMQGHGHAQVFGWIGSFILGIGFCKRDVRSGLALSRWLTRGCFPLHGKCCPSPACWN